MAENQLVEPLQGDRRDLFHLTLRQPRSTAATASTMESDVVYVLYTDKDVAVLESMATESVLTEEPPATVSVITVRASGSGESNIVFLSEGKKHLWSREAWRGLPYASGNQPLIYEALQEYLGFPGEAVATTSPWPAFWRHVEPQVTKWQDVFYYAHTRNVLFSQDVTLKTADLPRWKPKFIMDMQPLETEDA